MFQTIEIIEIYARRWRDAEKTAWNCVVANVVHVQLTPKHFSFFFSSILIVKGGFCVCRHSLRAAFGELEHKDDGLVIAAASERNATGRRWAIMCVVKRRSLVRLNTSVATTILHNSTLLQHFRECERETQRNWVSFAYISNSIRMSMPFHIFLAIYRLRCNKIKN